MGSAKKFCGFKNMIYFETNIDINTFAAKREIYPFTAKRDYRRNLQERCLAVFLTTNMGGNSLLLISNCSGDITTQYTEVYGLLSYTNLCNQSDISLTRFPGHQNN